MISYGYVGGAMVTFRASKAKDLNMSERMLVITLCSYANQTGQCWPSIKEIAKSSGGSIATVKRLLKAVQSKGYITITQRRDKAGDLTSNLYQLNIEKTAPAEPEKVVSINKPAGKTTEEKLFDTSWADNDWFEQLEG